MFGTNNTAKNLIREGVVSEVYPEKHSARVTFPDKNNLVSSELPVLTGAAFKNQSYWLPDINERVVVLMSGNAGTSGAGYIVGSLYTGENKPEEGNRNMYSLKFSDEAKISYRRPDESDKDDKRHAFQMTFADKTEILFENDDKGGDFEIKFSDGCEIRYSFGNGDGEFSMKFADGSTIEHDRRRGELSIDNKGEINISATGEINIESRADVNIQGAAIHLN